MPYQLTPAQLELQAARKAAKLAAKASSSSTPTLSPQELERRRFLKRSWIEVRESKAKRRVKIITWNILAQTLVRRELFPGSDCLKWSDRKPLLQAELEHHSSADILCLQECDRLDDFLPSLPDHSHIYTSGPGKKHGLVVLFRASRFRARAQRTVQLDEQELSPFAGLTNGISNGTNSLQNKSEADSSSSDGLGRKRGGSRITKNVGLIVALEKSEDTTQGVVVATTHLFWHPKFSYERIRQLILLLRAIKAFKKENDCDSWPTILAGDLNTTPCEATYQLIAGPGQDLPPGLEQEFEASRFVHHSIEKSLTALAPTEAPTVNLTAESANTAQSIADQNRPNATDDDDDEEDMPDTDERSVAGTRAPRASDGILTLPRLVASLQEFYTEGLRSAYDTSDWTQGTAETFASRGGFGRHFEHCPANLKGQNEPGYTCYTPLFKLTLDYLLLFPHDDLTVTALLQPAQSSELGGGLPRKGICASDHLAVGCEIAW